LLIQPLLPFRDNNLKLSLLVAKPHSWGAGPIAGNPFGVARWRAEGGAGDKVRFFQTSKRPISFTQQTIKYRHLCRSALMTACNSSMNIRSHADAKLATPLP